MSSERNLTELYCQIKEAFQIFDRDNDNVITKEEEKTILRMFGIGLNEKEEKDKDKKKNEEEKKDENEENKEDEEEKKDEEEEEKKDEEEEENKEEENKDDENKEKNEEEDKKIETVEFNEFFDNIQRRLGEAINDQQILSEIVTSNILNIRELEHELKTSKEHINNELVEKILKESTPNGGNYVVYKDLVKLMLNN